MLREHESHLMPIKVLVIAKKHCGGGGGGGVTMLLNGRKLRGYQIEDVKTG